MTSPHRPLEAIRAALPGRLDAVAGLVPAEAGRVAEVGYDHGKLLVRLLESSPQLAVVGVERQEACAARFRRRHGERLAAWGGRLQLLTGDGLAPLRARPPDVVVMAGLGEPTLLRLLEEAPAIWQAAGRVVLCPFRHEVILRPGLARLGLAIVDERLARSGRRIFEVIAAEPRVPGEDAPDPVARRFGPRLVARREPALALVAAHLRGLYRAALARDLRDHRDGDGALTPLGEKLALLPELERRLASWARGTPGSPARTPTTTR